MNRVSVYDPFAEAFPSLFRGFFQPTVAARDAIDIRMDVTETAKDYVVHAEMPGVSKEDIQVQIDGNQVRIAAEVKRVTDVKPEAVSEGKGASNESRVLRSERYYGAVARSFALASDIDEERASARFENGVLTLTLPKKAAVSAKRLAIN